jgi:hypothetical protein
VGRAAACRALHVPRASLYRHLRPAKPPAAPTPRPSPPRALAPAEHQRVLEVLNSERFRDRAPAEVFATLLDEGSYLCSIVTQIITTLRWESEFRTEGIENLSDFKSVIEEANGIDPPFDAFRCPTDSGGPEAVKSAVLGFVRRLDTVLDLLERTADGLAAEWDLRSGPTALEGDWPGGKLTIQ